MVGGERAQDRLELGVDVRLPLLGGVRALESTRPLVGPSASAEKRCSNPRSPMHISTSPTYCAEGTDSDVLRWSTQPSASRGFVREVRADAQVEVHDLHAATPEPTLDDLVGAVRLPAGAGEHLVYSSSWVGSAQSLSMSVKVSAGRRSYQSCVKSAAENASALCGFMEPARPSVVITMPP